MTPDEKFSRIIKVSIVGFLLIFAYFLFADIYVPLTTEARATRSVTKVAPLVSGEVVKVNVVNNQKVTKGEVLFEINPDPYQLAVEEAQLAVEHAKQANKELDASIEAAKATLLAQKSVANQRAQEAARIQNLYQRKGVSKQERDQASSLAMSAKANMLAAQAQLDKLEVSRGLTGENNLAVRQAQNRLKQAQLNLTYTKVVAEQDGVITNMYLQAGSFKTMGSPAMALIADDLDVFADFREKNIIDAKVGDLAYIAFDAKPGRIYKAHIESIDAGVSSGQFNADGQLASPQTSTRWVRDAQRIRVHFVLQADQDLPQNIAVGARASVQLVPDNFILSSMAWVQVHFISLLHFIY